LSKNQTAFHDQIRHDARLPLVCFRTIPVKERYVSRDSFVNDKPQGPPERSFRAIFI